MERQQLSDEELQAYLHTAELPPVILRCPKGNQITRICTNSACAVSLICSNPNCPSCNVSHQICPSIAFQNMTALINDRSDQFKSLVMATAQSQSELIRVLESGRKQLAQRCIEDSLDKGCKRVIEEVYTKKNASYLSGREAGQLLDRLQVLSKQGKIKVKRIADEYQQEMKKIAQKINEVKSQLLVKVRQQFRSEEHYIDSRILPGKTVEEQDKIDFLWQSLGDPYQLQLIFRASEHSFSSQAFHEKCDGIADTLTLIRTEFGKTIAGFTHYKWTSDNSNDKFGKFVDDSEQKAFILSLDLKQKMVPVSSNYLIYCSKSVGPTFGEGDLQICHECHLRRGSYSSFPNRYNSEGEFKYRKGQQSLRVLTGCEKGDSFLVKEYEVYRVLSRQPLNCQCAIM